MIAVEFTPDEVLADVKGSVWLVAQPGMMVMQHERDGKPLSAICLAGESKPALRVWMTSGEVMSRFGFNNGGGA